MTDDEKPDPIEDVRKGLGLLFRAARGAIEKLPTKDLEEVVVTGAREVGRAIGNVGKTIERDVFHRPVQKPVQEPVQQQAPTPPPAAEATPPDEPRKPDAT